jgi:hypothetical protein
MTVDIWELEPLVPITPETCYEGLLLCAYSGQSVSIVIDEYGTVVRGDRWYLLALRECGFIRAEVEYLHA